MKNIIKVVVNPDKCRMTGGCMKTCPVEGAIIVKEGKAFIVQEKCNLDGICIPACPNQAISAVEE